VFFYLHVSLPEPYMCLSPSNMPHVHSSHYSTFHHPKNMWSEVQIIRILNIQSPLVSSYRAPPGLPVLPQRPIRENPQPMFLAHCQRSYLRPHKQTDKNTVPLLLIFIFLDDRVGTPALISRGEVTGVQTQDVYCLPSVWIPAAKLASQPGGRTVIRTWQQAEITIQRSNRDSAVQRITVLPPIVLPSIYCSHNLCAHYSSVIVTTHRGVRFCSDS
jgi:hypothetical protein